MDIMRFHKFTLAAVVVSCTISLPGLSQAGSVFHNANSEAGSTFHPEHLQVTRSRAEVVAEVSAARKDGTLELIQRGVPLPIRNAGPVKTRQQVIDEMRSESLQQRQARMQLISGG